MDSSKSLTDIILENCTKIKNDRFQVATSILDVDIHIMDTETGRIAKVSVFGFNAVAKTLNALFPKPKVKKS